MDLINKELIINGTSISSGIAKGTVCHYQTGSIESTAIFKINEELIEAEIEKLKYTIEKSKEELNQLTINVRDTLGENEAKIFETHILILEDMNVINKIINKVKKEYINIEYAIKSTFEELEEIFAKMDDEYMKDRGTDFAELKRRLLSHLTGETGRFLCAQHCEARTGTNRIVLSKELTTSMINLINTNNVKGFITETLGLNSHAAILVRAAGIPCMTGIDIIHKIKCGTSTIIDSDNNKIIFNPSEKTVNQYEVLIREQTEEQLKADEEVVPIIKYKDKIDIELNANLLNISDFNLINNKFASIGLVRTEYLFYENKNFPVISEQEKVYCEIVKKAGGKSVTFRLFDLGGDKKIKSIKFSEEENPMLGLRGIRYLLKYRKILEDQIRAILTSSFFGPVKILLPVVADINEIKYTKDIIEDIKKCKKIKSEIPVGIMFEVPATIINPEPFLKVIDFGSIGSNDLLQYLYGVDRNNSDVSYLYKLNSDILYILIKKLADEAAKFNVPITLCGELDYNSDFIYKIIESGIKSFSISPIGFRKFINKIKST